MTMEDAKISVSADQRRHDRFRVDAQIKYKVINRQAVEELVEPRPFQDDGKSVNISVSGLAITTATLLRKGDYLKMEVTLPGMPRPTRALAEVMWVEPKGEAHLSGIRFLIILNEADDNSIRRFVDSLRSE